MKGTIGDRWNFILELEHHLQDVPDQICAACSLDRRVKAEARFSLQLTHERLKSWQGKSLERTRPYVVLWNNLLRDGKR